MRNKPPFVSAWNKEKNPASMANDVGRNLTIKAIPPEDRPRERLINQGAHGMSSRDLLAIILRTGTTSVTVTQMAEQILQTFGGLDGLDRAAISELCLVPGLGEAKACQLKAALELGRRLRKQGVEKGYQVRSPQDVFDALQLQMGALEHEQFTIVLLDTKNRIVAVKSLYEGSLNSTTVRTGEVFREAVRQNCASIIVAHNHPSGDPAPSPEDVRVTEALVKAGRLLDIEVLDHVIIAGNDYLSLKEKKLGFK